MHLLNAFSFCKCACVESTCKEILPVKGKKKTPNKHQQPHSAFANRRWQNRNQVLFSSRKTNAFSCLAKQLNYLLWYTWNTKTGVGEPNDICAQRPDHWWQVPHWWVQEVLSSCCIYCNSLPSHCDTSREQERVVMANCERSVCWLAGQYLLCL